MTEHKIYYKRKNYVIKIKKKKTILGYTFTYWSILYKAVYKLPVEMVYNSIKSCTWAEINDFDFNIIGMKQYRIEYLKPYFIFRKFRKFLGLFPSWKVVYYTVDFNDAQKMYTNVKNSVNITMNDFDFDALYYEETLKLSKIKPKMGKKTFIKKRE